MPGSLFCVTVFPDAACVNANRIKFARMPIECQSNANRVPIAVNGVRFGAIRCDSTFSYLQPCDYVSLPSDVTDWDERELGDDGISLDDFDQLIMGDLRSFPSFDAWHHAATAGGTLGSDGEEREGDADESDGRPKGGATKKAKKGKKTKKMSISKEASDPDEFDDNDTLVQSGSPCEEPASLDLSVEGSVDSHQVDEGKSRSGGANDGGGRGSGSGGGGNGGGSSSEHRVQRSQSNRPHTPESGEADGLLVITDQHSV
jgi:uncharacterized membrane protein YgcG